MEFWTYAALHTEHTATQWSKLFAPKVTFELRVKKHCVFRDLFLLSVGAGAAAKFYTPWSVMQLQYSYLVLLFHSAAQALGIDFYLEGGEGDVNFCRTSPRALLFSSVPLFTLFQRCDRAGWVETIQPGETRRHWHTLSSQMCSQEWWRRHELVGSVLDFISQFDSHAPTGKHVSGCR